MVMQDVNHQLFTESVLEEVLLSMPGKDSDESPENVAKAEAILTEMDLLPYKACHPMGLSGGQKQRVAIASEIASERPVILFDEPTSGLDPGSRDELLHIFKRITADKARAILFSTHITSDLDRCADDITYIQNGNVLKSADKDAFLRSFDHLRTSEDKQPLTLEEIMLRTERSDFDETAL